MKKLFSMTLTAVMLLSLLAGCGGKDAPSAGSIQVAALASGYMDTYPDMWKEVCQAFTDETGIQVDLITDKNLENRIGPAMQGGDFPDVVMLATGREAGLTDQFVKDRNIADISDVLSMTIPGEDGTVSDKILPGFLGTNATMPYGDGRTYLAPMFYSPCGLFYNAGLFAEKNWNVPATWDEMWELAEKAKAENISLFTYPTTGYFDGFLYALMYCVGGEEFFNDATSYAEGVWDTPEAQKCFEIIARLAENTNPVTPAQASDQNYTQNQQLVLDNKALFMPNGTWIVGEMKDAPRADGFAWGMTALPAAEAGETGASYTYLEQIWIPAGAENQDAAKQFIAFMYSDKAAGIFAKGGAVQPVSGIVDKLEGDNALFYSIYENGASAVVGTFSAYESVAGLGSVREVFLDPVNGLVNGTVTVDQWISGIKSASDQMRAHLMG